MGRKNIYKKYIIIFSIVAVLVAVSYFTVLAGDQSKTTEFYVGFNGSTFNTSSDFPFSVYIGDSLTGVATPVKDSSFIITGVYLGGGTISFGLDSDANSVKIFTLPSASNPENFSLIYKDDTGKMNHTSAGTYSHTLNVIPSGVTVAGFGAKVEMTHQFAPTACFDGQPVNQKIKTSEFFVGSVANAMNSSTVLPFSIYIGDDVSSITNPVKSTYFSVSGTYTGSGTINMGLGDSNGDATSTSFTLPAVSGANNFELLYHDDYNKINPSGSGTYNYNFNLSLSGPTVSNLAVKAIVTHRYKPVSCTAGYPAYGDLISAIYDSTASADGPAFNSITWKGKLGGTSQDQGKVKFQIAASDSPSGPWNYYGGSTCGSGDWYDTPVNTAMEVGCYSQFNNKRYFRYKIRLCSSDCLASGLTTPQVDDVNIGWSP